MPKTAQKRKRKTKELEARELPVEEWGDGCDLGERCPICEDMRQEKRTLLDQSKSSRSGDAETAQ